MESSYIMPKRDKEAILFIGLPGSGKTTYIKDHIRDFTIVSADDLKETHPDYNPKDPEKVHQWSVNEAEKLMVKYSDLGVPICMDSGGVNTNYSLRIIRMLKGKGYYIRLIYMNTPLYVCFERNKKRKMVVPEKAIWDKHDRLFSCLIKQIAEVDEYKTIHS